MLEKLSSFSSMRPRVSARGGLTDCSPDYEIGNSQLNKSGIPDQKMSKKIIWLSAVICILIIITSLLLFNRKSQIGKPIFINNHQINVEVADTDSLRDKGLSGKTNLPQDSGMLFIFPKSGIYSFWMKEMNFPLDFIWISNETIMDLTENVPNKKYSHLSELPLYSPDVPVDKVLEVNAGTVKLLNIKTGDKIKF